VGRPAVTTFATPQDLLGAVGTNLGTTDWVVVDQGRLDDFAEATGSPDPAYLSLALTNLFMPDLLHIEQMDMGVNYGTNTVRFPAALTEGLRLRGRATLSAVDELAGGVQATVTVTVEIDGSPEPACVVESLSRFFLGQVSGA
jgi:acyl dehydratase